MKYPPRENFDKRIRERVDSDLRGSYHSQQYRRHLPPLGRPFSSSTSSHSRWVENVNRVVSPPTSRSGELDERSLTLGKSPLVVPDPPAENLPQEALKEVMGDLRDVMT
ncbi:unnamed protein product [Cochlearia groenlandica]